MIPAQGCAGMSLFVPYFLLLQLSVVAIALVDLYGNRFGLELIVW